MNQLIINIEDDSKADWLISLIRELNFVKSVKQISLPAEKTLPVAKELSKDSFWKTFGTGKDTSITIDRIKSEAWRKHNL